MVIGAWLTAAKWLLAENGWKLLGMGAAGAINWASTTAAGKSGYGEKTLAESAEVSKAKVTEKRLQNLGMLKRDPVDIAVEDSEKKMYALRSFILSMTYKDDADNFFLTADEEEAMAYIENFASVMNVTVVKKFDGTSIPNGKACFEITALKKIKRKGEDGKEEIFPKVWWKKTLNSTVLVNPDTNAKELWFTWPKAM